MLSDEGRPPFEPVEFPSEGAVLRGRWYPSAGSAAPVPTVVMAHGFSATISMTEAWMARRPP